MADVAVKPGSRYTISRQTLRHVEFLAFSITVFVGKSLLLIRLPYRPPGVNALYTALLLLAFYLYFKFRYKITPPPIIVFFLAAAVAVDVAGNAFDFYRLSAGVLAENSGQLMDEAGNPIIIYARQPWLIQYDEIAHLLGSGFSLPPTMWLLMATTRRMGYRLPLDLLAFLSVAVTFSFCSYYEILELWDEKFYGDFQRLWTPQDSANDLQWDLAGIVAAALISAVVFKLVERGKEASRI
jgi:uncharacterized membrane protein YjdF